VSESPPASHPSGRQALPALTSWVTARAYSCSTASHRLVSPERNSASITAMLAIASSTDTGTAASRGLHPNRQPGCADPRRQLDRLSPFTVQTSSVVDEYAGGPIGGRVEGISTSMRACVPILHSLMWNQLSTQLKLA
jgi:hypothetical protein